MVIFLNPEMNFQRDWNNNDAADNKPVRLYCHVWWVWWCVWAYSSSIVTSAVVLSGEVSLLSTKSLDVVWSAWCNVIIPLFFFLLFSPFYIFYFVFFIFLKIVHRYTSTGGPSLPAFRPVYSTMRYWERRGPSIRDQRTPVSFHRFSTSQRRPGRLP